MDCAETIRVLLVKSGNKSVSWLAGQLGTTRQNLSRKMKQNYFTVEELEDISKALGCSMTVEFTRNGIDLCTMRTE